MKALILAGGIGKRLSPITETIPKAMIPLVGKPLLEHIIESLKANNIKDIYLVVGYMANKIQDYFGNGYKFDVNVTYIHQPSPTGVADAILRAEDIIDADRFLLLNSDVTITRELVQRVLEVDSRLHPEGLIAATLVTNPQFYGIVEVDADSRITKIIEKPSTETTHSHYAVAGLYLLNREIFESLKKYQALDKAIQHKINTTEGIYAVVWEKDWAEITWPWDILVANKLILRTFFKDQKGIFIAENANVSENANIEGPVYIEDNVTVRSGAQIVGPAYIGGDSYIGNNSLVRENTSINKNVKVGFGVEIKNSVVFNDAFIGRLSYVGDSIISENTMIGAGTQTWNLTADEKIYYTTVEGERIEVPLKKFGTVIGPGSDLGINVSIYPGVRIGARTIIDAGAIIKDCVPSDSHVRVIQQQKIQKRELPEK
ncbi:MAG: NTP transferase domain-containing protein [Candidatus Odinarchaeota archaeon]|nr:NTP transferase domain-containing protein [Candidatus Odinarchaeota archaeon]